jgi:hypothetical protein
MLATSCRHTLRHAVSYPIAKGLVSDPSKFPIPLRLFLGSRDRECVESCATGDSNPGHADYESERSFVSI